MSNDDLIKRISEKSGVPIDEVERQRDIPYTDAINQFLPPYLHDSLLKKVQEVDSRGSPELRASGEIALRGELTSYEKEFRESEEGRVWYECNFPEVFVKKIVYRRGGIKRVPKEIGVIGGPPRDNRKY